MRIHLGDLPDSSGQNPGGHLVRISSKRCDWRGDMTSTARRSNTEEISNVIDVLVGALRGKNVEGVVSVYAPDNVMFVLAPPLQYTKENAPG